MDNPLVSIIVPTLNQGQFIGETLNSILQQDYTNIECIVMDGGSTDETLDVLTNYNDPRLSWISEPDQGQSDAINKGMRRAQGEILSYLNSDDLLRPGTVKTVVDCFTGETGSAFIFGDCDLIDASGASIGSLTGKVFDIHEAFAGRFRLIQPGAFWRRAVYEAVKDFDVSMHYVMDTDYFLRTAIAGFQLIYVPKTLSAFRLHGESKTVSAQPKFLGEWRRMMDQLYARPDLPESLAILRAETDLLAEWALAKTYWMQKDYTSARPLLKKYIHGNKRGRQLLAVTMLLDSSLHTPFTRLLALVFRRITGEEVLFEGGRVI